ncbi:hypothetical protein [Streptomyces sp. NBC_01320]|uniref:hypothetical protein n=1 Tax=Streptomyces sp. NBC_01320 TaxID=2903824 RepID=UPI002E1143CE|nr:hypothetical protein OG395_55655 [Streptomyces sp. NBC_01320]
MGSPTSMPLYGQIPVCQGCAYRACLDAAVAGALAAEDRYTLLICLTRQDDALGIK